MGGGKISQVTLLGSLVASLCLEAGLVPCSPSPCPAAQDPPAEAPEGPACLWWKEVLVLVNQPDRTKAALPASLPSSLGREKGRPRGLTISAGGERARVATWGLFPALLLHLPQVRGLGRVLPASSAAIPAHSLGRPLPPGSGTPSASSRWGHRAPALAPSPRWPGPRSCSQQVTLPSCLTMCLTTSFPSLRLLEQLAEPRSDKAPGSGVGRGG